MDGCWIILIVVAMIVAIIIAAARESQKRMAAAKQTYELSLESLKADPTNSHLRQETLRLGRTYSNLTRGKAGVSLFDEVALMNDIDAACAGATRSTHDQTPPALSSTRSVEERLNTLQSLRSTGAITEDEYHDKRKRLIDEL